jgi:chemotaxis protein MotB
MSSHGSRKGVSQERWLVSYADFITLLFAFFVVLYAFARADQKKNAQVSQSIDEAFRSLGVFPEASRKSERGTNGAASGKAQDNDTAKGAEDPQVPMNIVMGEDVLSPAQVKQDLEHMRRELTQTLSNQVATHTVSIQMGHDGLVISLREAGFFNSGSADPKPETKPTIQRIAESLSRTSYDLRIEGHTDNVPIHTDAFDSNWELSTARATRIARMLMSTGSIGPDKLSAAGYAEFHPVAPNDTAEGRAQNRRVDIVVLPRTHTNFASAAQTGAPQGGAWKKITDGD